MSQKRDDLCEQAKTKCPGHSDYYFSDTDFEFAFEAGWDAALEHSVFDIQDISPELLMCSRYLRIRNEELQISFDGKSWRAAKGGIV